MVLLIPARTSKPRVRILLLSAILVAPTEGRASDEPVPEETEPPAQPRSDDDWPDLSEFLDEKYGFLPIVLPVTDPAVGYGAAGALAFLSRPLGEARDGLGRPSITSVGGLGTENGTWAAAAGDLRYWLDDRIQTTSNPRRERRGFPTSAATRTRPA